MMGADARSDRRDDAVAMVAGLGLVKAQDIVAIGLQVADAHAVIGIGRPHGSCVAANLDDQLHRWATKINDIGTDAKLTLEAQGICFDSLQAVPNRSLLWAMLQF
jgi:hypothetical protein